MNCATSAEFTSPSAERDIQQIFDQLSALAREAKVAGDFPERWFEEVEDAILGLYDFPERHAYAPEREAWGRDVRNVLLGTGYRVLFQVDDEAVWVLRVRHQRQQQFGAPAPPAPRRPSTRPDLPWPGPSDLSAALRVPPGVACTTPSVS